MIFKDRLERFDPHFDEILWFTFCYIAYIFTVICLLIPIGLALFLQWSVNSFLNPAESVGFLICFIAVMVGIFIVGVIIWERSNG